VADVNARLATAARFAGPWLFGLAAFWNL